MKNLLFIFIIIFSFISCQKNRPKEGKYFGVFNGSYIKNDSIIQISRGEDMYIVSSNKDEINFTSSYYNYTIGKSTSKLEKLDDKKVKGTLYLPNLSRGINNGLSDDINIDGKWEKEKGKYIIVGTFSYNYRVIDEVNEVINNYIVTGSFEIKSEF